MPSIQISDFLYAESLAVAQRHGVDPCQVIDQWAMAGMIATVRQLRQLLDLKRRTTPPDPGDEHNWQYCIDELTGPCWFPKAISDAFQAQQMMARKLTPANGSTSAVEAMRRFMDEAPAAGGDVDIKRLIEDGRS